jgi:GTP cyclohydrolase II
MALESVVTRLPTLPGIRVSVPLPVRRAGGAVARMVTFDGLSDGGDHFALVFDCPDAVEGPWVRLHSECVTGDVLGSARCDCGDQLDAALARFGRDGGVLVYLRQEGRGIGLKSKLDAYALQDKGVDTFAANEALGLPADAREYRIAAEMLMALGLKRVRLLTANPVKVQQIRDAGIEVAAAEALPQTPTPWNRRYLEAKQRHFAALQSK